MKKRKDKRSSPILAAGGIVLRGSEPEIAVVQLRKMGAWVLPKGKLAAGESAVAAAQREVLEETGHRVSVHEFLGTLGYEAGRGPKVVQFWRMQAIGGPAGKLMRDVKTVRWLPLEAAIAQLTHPRERAFLEQVGPIALRSAGRSARGALSGARSARKGLVERTRASSGTPVIAPAGSVAPVDVALPDDAVTRAGPELAAADEAIGDVDGAPDPASPATSAPPAKPSVRTANAGPGTPAAGRSVFEKAWAWLRQATLPEQPRQD